MKFGYVCALATSNGDKLLATFITRLAQIILVEQVEYMKLENTEKKNKQTICYDSKNIGNIKGKSSHDIKKKGVKASFF